MSASAVFDHRMSEGYQGASPNARFLAGSVPASHTSWKSYAQRTTSSLVAHIVAVLLVVFVMTRPVREAAREIFKPPPDITWVAIPGPGGGGGGGGDRTPEPLRKVEITPPKPRVIEPPKVEPPKPLPQMNIPAVTAVAELPGAQTSISVPAPTLGPGAGGGGGTGTGSGVGPGTGPGYGPGSGGGFGGGVYREGNGVTSPVLIREAKPNYTGEAMRARIQGLVVMDAIVMPDGSVGNVRITKSLDPTFGLDQEAIATVRKWRFKPGMRLGEPVAVLIQVEMSFTLR